METRICTKCNIEKELDLFTSDKRRKQGRTSICKECCKLSRRDYYKKYHSENKDKKIQISKEWYLKNRDRKLIRDKEYRQRPEIKVRHRERQNRYYHENDSRKKYLQQYSQRNISRIREVKKLSFRRNMHKTLTRKQSEREFLSAPYVKERLRYQYGVHDSVLCLHPAIIELKRFELKAKRYVKQNK
uniref:hypothetical protein n=1 Tax=uncultured Dysgonomonas sp. TaxID=206096 RepID=UPI0026339BD8|nr:hypothetical protein [uncultured Dysgonomonas sp.]